MLLELVGISHPPSPEESAKLSQTEMTNNLLSQSIPCSMSCQGSQALKALTAHRARKLRVIKRFMIGSAIAEYNVAISSELHWLFPLDFKWSFLLVFVDVFSGL